METRTEPRGQELFEAIMPRSPAVRGPAPDAAPVHGAAGRWYIGLGRVGAFFGFLFLAAASLAATGVVTLPAGAPAPGPLDLALYWVGFAAMVRVLRGLDEFEPASWWITMATLGCGLAAGAYSLVGGDLGDAAGTAPTLLLNLVWARYFWSRRGDFDIDL